MSSQWTHQVDFGSLADQDVDGDGYFDSKQDSDNDGVLNKWDTDDDNDGALRLSSATLSPLTEPIAVMTNENG